MSPKTKILVLLGGGAALALIAWVALTAFPGTAGDDGAPHIASTTEATSSSTPVAEVPGQKTLPPEEPLMLPPGATAIDAYAYVKDGQVYFRSLTGKTPLDIPDSDAASFRRLSSFVTYPGTAIVEACGGTPLYAYYGDDRQVYFYQVWRTPRFRSSRVEVIIDAKTADFSITSPQTAMGGGHIYEVGYGKATATSSCRLSLSRTTL